MSDPANRPGLGDIAEAAAALATAAIAIRLFPFRRVAEMLAQPASEQSVRVGDVERVRRAINAWGRRLPIPPKCFVRGLAAVWMLRRRNIASTLYYGAATIEGKLKAHVWVRSGEQDVVGCEIASDYALLARFPSAEEGISPQKW